MNFLAHIYLSGENSNVMVGNFIGDFVKGRNLVDQFDPEIAMGIELHRSIDDYTDHHPIVRESKLRLRPKYRHYSPVIVDVYYDHFLSKYWSNYHDEPLLEFSVRTYKTLESYRDVLPYGVSQLLPYMIKANWLLNYGTFDGIAQALNGMSRRSRYDSRMDESLAELREHYDAFKGEFEEFFPDLVTHCKYFLAMEDKNHLH
ncbi:MAG: ACP phosphodiesterase [Chryseolinea sp.]